MKIIILNDKMTLEMPFTAGISPAPEYPLARYLPPLPAGMAEGWCRARISPGSWVIDPLCSTPLVPLELARAGYRVLVASNNPILTFMLEILARAPSRSDFEAALAELVSLRRGEERLETHFRSLYQTECASCHQMIQPEAFLWRRGENQPFARVYRCPYCKDEGERPVVPGDIERLSLPGNPALHRARALERIALSEEILNEGAKEIIQFFLPRSLYFLTTLINRVEGMAAPETRKRLLTALILNVSDNATCLWPYPESRSRPRQLTIPPVFRENNLWRILETAMEDWLHPGDPVKLSHWPELPPPTGGICLFSGRLKELVPFQAEGMPQASVMAIPRPNQAFWTLSAVWSGWLWGREAVAPLKVAFERQRYDWQWHTQALHSIFSQLAQHLPKETPLWGMLPEIVPGFLTAAILAGELGNLRLEGISLRDGDDLAQLLWKPSAVSGHLKGRPVDEILEDSVKTTLARMGEPVPYILLHAAGLVKLAMDRPLNGDTRPSIGEALAQLQNGFTKVFKSGQVLRRYERQASQNIETGWWWLANQAGLTVELPLADRVEVELVRWLVKYSGKPLGELKNNLFQLFPGVQTPSEELIQFYLRSYAEPDLQDLEIWRLRKTEQPAVRKEDLRMIQRGLVKLGDRLGYQTQGELPLIWQSKPGAAEYLFFPIASAFLSRYVYQAQALPPERCIFVVPGSRINLILYKLKRDPRLAEAVSSGWRFMKFRLIRQMLDLPTFSLETFVSNLSTDPPRWEDATQLVML